MSAGITLPVSVASRNVTIPPLGLAGTLAMPKVALGLVVFAHGSGSSRVSPRNTAVAQTLHDRGFATLLFDLLTSREESDRTNVFDISLLAARLVDVVQWIGRQQQLTANPPIGLFGASTGAAAALVAAARLPERIGAIVSRGGRPDLAGDTLPLVRARPCLSSAAPMKE